MKSTVPSIPIPTRILTVLMNDYQRACHQTATGRLPESLQALLREVLFRYGETREKAPFNPNPVLSESPDSLPRQAWQAYQNHNRADGDTLLSRLEQPDSLWLARLLNSATATEQPSAESRLWQAGFYLLAHQERLRSFFDQHTAVFTASLDQTDGRYLAIAPWLSTAKSLLDAGCGKGRFLNLIHQNQPGTRCVGVDVSAALLSYVPLGIEACQGNLECLPLPDNSFDVSFCIEAFEHATNPPAALRELCRVTKPGGHILIIDKHQGQWGRLETPVWEQWPDVQHLKQQLQQYCDNTRARPIAYDGKSERDGLMILWQGQKKTVPEDSTEQVPPTDPSEQTVNDLNQIALPETRPLISLIIRLDDNKRAEALSPQYSQLVKETLHACLQQTWQPLEVLLCSKQVAHIQSQLASSLHELLNDTRRDKITQQNTLRWVEGNLNEAIRQARGSWISWLTPGCVLDSQAIETLWQTGARQKSGCLIFAKPTPDKEPLQTLYDTNRVGPVFLYPTVFHQHLGDYTPSFSPIDDHEFWVRIQEQYPVIPLNQSLQNLSPESEERAIEAPHHELMKKGLHLILLKKYHRLRWSVFISRYRQLLWQILLKPQALLSPARSMPFLQRLILITQMKWRVVEILFLNRAYKVLSRKRQPLNEQS